MSTLSRGIAASYARRATDAPPSPSEQSSVLAELAGAHGFTIPDKYRFEDVGSGADTSRPGFNAMLAHACRRGTFSRIYVTEPTRLGRWSDCAHHFHFRAVLSMLGVDIVFARDEPLEVRR